jgi:hypothetical protein
MVALTMPEGPASAQVREDRREFRRLLVLTTAVLLVVAGVSRLLPQRWRPPGASPPGQGSLLAEARTAAAGIVPFAFMS